MAGMVERRPLSREPARRLASRARSLPRPRRRCSPRAPRGNAGGAGTETRSRVLWWCWVVHLWCFISPGPGMQQGPQMQLLLHGNIRLKLRQPRSRCPATVPSVIIYPWLSTRWGGVSFVSTRGGVVSCPPGGGVFISFHLTRLDELLLCHTVGCICFSPPQGGLSLHLRGSVFVADSCHLYLVIPPDGVVFDLSTCRGVFDSCHHRGQPRLWRSASCAGFA